MSLPPSLDFDKLTTIVLKDVTHALKDWLTGMPKDEVALMNHVTGKLNRIRRGCDVGVAKRVHVKSKLALLHRKGPKQKDRYGADLAITVVMDDLSFIKTALLQFKKGSNFKAKLEKRQLDDAAARKSLLDRSFVMYADEGRTGIRFKAVAPLRSSYKTVQKQKTFNTASWRGLVQWMWDWLSCDIGLISKQGAPNSVEALLDDYVIENDWISPWGESDPDDPPDDLVPARAWIVLFFIREDSDSSLAKKLTK
jgi:hypothetical protein